MDGLVWALLALAVVAVVLVALAVRGDQRPGADDRATAAAGGEVDAEGVGAHGDAAGEADGDAAGEADSDAAGEADSDAAEWNDGDVVADTTAGAATDTTAGAATDTTAGAATDVGTARREAEPGAPMAEPPASASYDERHSAHWQDGRPPLTGEFPGDDRAAGVKERVEGRREPPDQEHA